MYLVRLSVTDVALGGGGGSVGYVRSITYSLLRRLIAADTMFAVGMAAAVEAEKSEL